MDAFLLSFGVILLAELGDKSQLMALGFAARYPLRTVLAAISVATLLLNAGSVVLGVAAAAALPTNVIKAAGGLAFLAFAAWSLRGDRLGEREESRTARGGRWAFLAVGTAFLVAELGDKTMLATITLAATEEPIGTWLGSTAGMVVADAIAIGIGSILGARLPEREIKILGATAFMVFGLLLLAEGLANV